jgi:hypothetical protein
MRKLLWFAVMLLLRGCMLDPSQAQNVEGQPIASQYGAFQLQGNATNSFVFSPTSCQVTAGNTNFAAVTQGVPIRIVDPGNRALDETVTAGLVNINACSVQLAVNNTHIPPFYLTSGTAGLQEAINANNHGGTANTIVIDAGFYALGGTTRIITSVQGTTTLGLVDLGFEFEMRLNKSAAKAAQAVQSEPALQTEIRSSTNQMQPIGATDVDSGRLITQPSDDPAINQALATDAMREYRGALEVALEGIPGAKLAANRTAKNPKRLAEKIELQGQPAETVNDYGAARISVDSLNARNAVVAAVKRKFPILREEDEFSHGDPQYGYRCYAMQVQMANRASQELQIVPKEIFDVNRAQHQSYKQARDTGLTGKNAEAVKLRAKALNDAAMGQFNKRNGFSTQPAFRRGANVTLPDGSEAKILYLDSNMGIARVRTNEGRNLTIRRHRLRASAAKHADGEFSSLDVPAKDLSLRPG